VTCLAFADPPAGPAPHLFFATADGADGGGDGGGAGEVASLRLPAAATKAAYVRLAPRVLEDRGAARGCAAWDGRELVVARRDGLYLYGADDRGGALGFDGEKTAVACLGRGYVVVASLHDKSRRGEINVYDVKHRRISWFYRHPAGETTALLLGTRPDRGADGAAATAPSLSSAYVVASNGGCVRFDEKATPEKLDVLYRMNMYPTAIQVASAAALRPAAVMEIYCMYGDHLYKKCDWDGAIDQYSRTIGHVEPSYVIRRFLDAQRVRAPGVRPRPRARARGRRARAGRQSRDVPRARARAGALRRRGRRRPRARAARAHDAPRELLRQVRRPRPRFDRRASGTPRTGNAG